jgi:hypothetical protein
MWLGRARPSAEQHAATNKKKGAPNLALPPRPSQRGMTERQPGRRPLQGVVRGTTAVRHKGLSAQGWGFLGEQRGLTRVFRLSAALAGGSTLVRLASSVAGMHRPAHCRAVLLNGSTPDAKTKQFCGGPTPRTVARKGRLVPRQRQLGAGSAWGLGGSVSSMRLNLSGSLLGGSQKRSRRR